MSVRVHIGQVQQSKFPSSSAQRRGLLEGGPGDERKQQLDVLKLEGGPEATRREH
jgi:hypothetical protein